jgi:hypothetical protein
MAVFARKCSNTKVKVNSYDHLPAHCHVFPEGRNVRVSLHTLEVLHPKGVVLTSQLRACLKEWQMEMLEAWEKVVLSNGGDQNE